MNSIRYLAVTGLGFWLGAGLLAPAVWGQAFSSTAIFGPTEVMQTVSYTCPDGLSDVVDFDLVVNAVEHFTGTPSGGFAYHFSSTLFGEGRGATGIQYRFVRPVTDTFTSQNADGDTTFSNSRIIKQMIIGDGNVFTAHFFTIYTFVDGEFVVMISDAELECH